MFETRTRENGETFVTLRDGAPEWLRDAVMAAHDDEMPNDWRYETCSRIWDALTDGNEVDDHELADGLVDIYTGNRLAWLADHTDRAGLVDEAHTELGSERGDIAEQIGIGQYWVLSRMVGIIREALDEAHADYCAETDDRNEVAPLEWAAWVAAGCPAYSTTAGPVFRGES